MFVEFTVARTGSPLFIEDAEIVAFGPSVSNEGKWEVLIATGARLIVDEDVSEVLGQLIYDPEFVPESEEV